MISIFRNKYKKNTGGYFFFFKNDIIFSMNKIDRKILFPVIALVFGGIFIFLSASLTYLKNPEYFTKIFLLQLSAIAIGSFMIYFIQRNKYINYLNIKNNSIYFFIISILLQLAVLLPVIGVTINGSTRWLNIGFMTIQPSEIFRLSVILFVANILFFLSKEIKNFKFFLKISIVPFILIVLFYYLTSDLGSLIILLSSVFAMVLFTEIDKKKILALAIGGVMILFYIAWNFSDHAHDRLKDFIYPEQADITGSFYQNNNMMEAVGSGQLMGMGYGESLQKFNGLIPEAISDSIFSIFAEEWGFIGSLILIFTYLFLAYAIFTKIKYIKNKYQKYVVAGLGVNLLFPAFYNIGASISIVPLSGIPLTFISKGGTSILIALVSVGIILLFSRK